MKTLSKGVVLSFAGAAALAMAGNALAKGSKKATLMPAASMQWKAGPAPGVQTAALWGDMMKGGAYGVLVKFDKGLAHPPHHHTGTLRIVVLSGTFWQKDEGAEKADLGPGSYLSQPGGGVHESGCSADADCTFFMAGTGKFDLIPEKK